MELMFILFALGEKKPKVVTMDDLWDGMYNLILIVAKIGLPVIFESYDKKNKLQL